MAKLTTSRVHVLRQLALMAGSAAGLVILTKRYKLRGIRPHGLPGRNGGNLRAALHNTTAPQTTIKHIASKDCRSGCLRPKEDPICSMLRLRMSDHTGESITNFVSPSPRICLSGQIPQISWSQLLLGPTLSLLRPALSAISSV